MAAAAAGEWRPGAGSGDGVGEFVCGSNAGILGRPCFILQVRRRRLQGKCGGVANGVVGVLVVAVARSRNDGALLGLEGAWCTYVQ